MEARLVQFIDSVETISNIRNLDPLNPVEIILEHPTNAARYTIVAALIEPSYMEIPIHTIWVVMGPDNSYYRKALKLLSSNPPTIVSLGILGFNSTWIEITTYNEIFSDPQYYVTLSGPPGPRGPKGEPELVYRDQWKHYLIYNIGEIVYFYGSSYISKVNNNSFNVPEISTDEWGILAKAGEDYTGPHTLISIGLEGTTGLVYEGQTIQTTVTAYYTDGSSRNVTRKTLFTITPGTVASVDIWGLFTTELVGQDTLFEIEVSYTENGTTCTDSLVNTILTSSVLRLTIEGPSKIFIDTTATYEALVLFNSGVVKNVTEDVEWNIYQGLDGCEIENGGMFISGSLPTSGNILAALTHNLEITVEYKALVVTEQINIYPFYGTALEDSVKNSTFILNLPGRGLINDRIAQFTLDGGSPGSGLSMFFAYPAIYGLATFTDLSNNLEGGWDGVANDPVNNTGPITIPVVIGNMQIDFYLYQTDYAGWV